MKENIKRDSAIDLFNGILKTARDAGALQELDRIIDYDSACEFEEQNKRPISNYEFATEFRVDFGGSEGIYIDAWLNGSEYVKPPKNEIATFDKLNTWYYTDAPKTVRPTLDIIRRQTSFDEVVSGLDESNALFEARRCLSCGNCFECDNCYGVCPDNAVIKLGPGKKFEFNYDYCKGCGICVEECPCGAIKMEPEEI